MKCRTCGTTLSAGALLCGECGTSAIAPRPTLGDTERYDRRALLDAIAREQAARSATRSPQHAAPASAPAPDRAPASGPAAAAAPAGAAPSAPEAAAAPGVPAGHDEPRAPRHEPQHAAAATPRSALFSLVFSTGESIRVAGSGLVGRNPVAADGERVDYLVQIVDPHRSVSKTHLEFGVEGDTLWIADRGSANGTRFNLDLVEPIELSPGERIRVPRGTRIGIGDQWFDVH